MNIMIREFSPEHGEIALAGKKADGLCKDTRYLYSDCNVAYCPQFNTLFLKATCEEHLNFYACIRGLNIEDQATRDHINAIMKLLSLQKYKTKRAESLSGGYKRRLCLGIAMVCYPKCLLIDEVTSGVDPSARRKIWDVLKPNIDHEGYDVPAILISTHNLEEAEELSTRIGIMIDGELITTGTISYLLNRYCTCFFVEISTNNKDCDMNIIKIFEKKKMDATVYESLPYYFKLQIPFTKKASGIHTQQLADIFDIIETNKTELQIKAYSVAKMTLEQIFMNLSRKQFEADIRYSQRQIISQRSNGY